VIQRGRCVSLVALVLTLTLLATPSAFAGTSAATNDRDDVSGPLDIIRLELTRAASNNPLDIVLSFYQKVPAKLFSSGGHAYVYFDTSSNPGIEWTGSVVKTRNGLALVLKGPGPDARVPVTRPNDHALGVTIQGSTPANPNGHVNVYARSTYQHRQGPCKHTCRDRAPDTGSLGL
jgi:hypothetical protein